MNCQFRFLQIKKRSFPQWLSLGVFVLPLLFLGLIDFFKIPSFIKYGIDVMWVLLLVFMVFSRQINVKKNTAPFVVIVALWLIYITIGYIFNYQSVFYFLWGLRNNFRFYVAFFAFASFLDEDDSNLIFTFTDCLFWINIPVTFFQFFVLGYKQDYLGGIFGTERGCNAFTTILFVFVVARSLLLCFQGKEKVVICVLKSGFSLLLSAMSELKFFFLVFVIIGVLAMILTKFSWKKMFLLVAFAAVLSFTGSVLTILFGNNEELTVQRIMQLITSQNYATNEDLGRFTAIPTISRDFLIEWYEKLFGMGIGNCDTSAFAICNTPFYQANEYLHYNWFSSAFLFLETGYIGLILNLLFYCMVGFLSIKKMRSGKCNKFFCQMAVIFSIVCIMLTFYNSTLRKEVGYIAYFVLALPFISLRDKESSQQISV